MPTGRRILEYSSIAGSLGLLLFVVFHIYIVQDAYRPILISVPTEESHQEVSPAAYVDQVTKNGVRQSS
jgi:hypothetical protein